MLSREAARFREARVFDLFRRMASAAACRIHIRGQLRLHAGLGVAGGALLMSGERAELALRVELMAEGAIRAKTGLGIDARFLVHMLLMREIEEDGARTLITGKRNQVVGAGWRKRTVALRANLLF